MNIFQNKVSVVTGAGSGIGQALAFELARYGASLALSDVDEAGLATTKTRIEEEFPGCYVRCFALDVSSREGVFAHADEVKAEFGAAHFLFNNAGVALYATIENMTLDEYDWLMGINLGGVVYGTKAFLPIMRAQNEGHIVNISSVLGLFSTPASGAYTTSKFAVRGFTETLARELEGTKLYASCVHPGGIKTNISSAGRMGSKAGTFEQQCIDNATQHLKTTPGDLAKAILKGVVQRKRRIVAGDSALIADIVARLFPSNYGRLFHALKGL